MAVLMVKGRWLPSKKGLVSFSPNSKCRGVVTARGRFHQNEGGEGPDADM